MSDAAILAVEETKNAQRAAADPGRSAFVAANAGAGKTRVLTDRVARLLLQGTSPARILCITYTKAAAAEMAHRLFKLLGDWALADDDKLNAALVELEGEQFVQRGPSDLAAARRLFARALETPGGLKIQTIHSFCESVLKRFPLEAGVPPGFTVIDEVTTEALGRAAVDEAATSAVLERAFARLTARCTPEALCALLTEQLLNGQKMRDALDFARGWERLADASATALGVARSDTAESVMAATLAGVADGDIARAQLALGKGGKTCRQYAGEELRQYLETRDATLRFELLRKVLLTQKNEPRDRFPDMASIAADGWVGPYIRALQESFAAACARMKAAENNIDTRAFLSILETAKRAYDRAKAARAGLDYDDLVAGVKRLFDATDASWVRYKLDQGLDHILLDEAQDTSPSQWRVVEGPLEEFFAGKGARDAARTFFAVGDEKQSIYSFQGADAGLFSEKEQDLGARIAAVADFRNVRLDLSFRSTAPVLDFVDALFADEAAAEGVTSEHPLKHKVKRAGAAGLVELWPRVPRPEKPETKAWDAPLDAPPQKPEAFPARRLALAVAAKIKDWLAAGEPLLSRDRAIRASDILVLVQSRSALFHEMIRALTEKGVTVAGADKLQLLEDAAVEDLLSYARCALLAADELSLAETLKSPFFGLDDDSLFALAHGREGSLWRALKDRAEERPEWRRAREEIVRARAIGLREGAYAFFSHVLERGAPSGRKRLYARLGEASAEPIAELLRQALDYELSNARSLQGFVVWAERYAGEIKREMEQAADSVRVMTVHGAKGLESEIVFLIDAHRYPNTGEIGPLFFAPVGKHFAPVFSPNKDCDGATAAEARAEARRRAYEEYRRLLYVAATRARDRLYICGLEQGNDRNARDKPTEEKSWYALAEDAFDRLVEQTRIGESFVWGGAAQIFETSQTAEPEREKTAPAVVVSAAPAWLNSPAPAERAPLRLAPSRLADDAEAKAEHAAFSPGRSADKFLRGRTIHRLLELLPEIQPAERTAAADRLLARLAPEAMDLERAAWRGEALAVLDHPTFAPVFAPGSRAEVGVAGKPRGMRDVVAGQIDRLAVAGSRVLIVDYKTNRPPPQRLEDVAAAYIAQLAAYRALLQEIYPGHQIEAALLWTYDARLTPIPEVMLDHAFARLLA